MRWTYRAIDDVPPGRRAEFHGTPLVIGDLVLAGTDDRDPGGIGHLYAFERDLGHLRWKAEAGRGVMADLVHRGSRVYVVSLSDEIRCIDVRSGQTLWSHASRAVLDSSQSIGFVTTPALVGDKVIFGGQDGTMAALDAERGTLRWSRTVGSPIQSAVVDSGNCVYFATRDRRLLRLDTRDGHDLGEMQLGARTFGPPVVATDGLLVLVVEQGGQSGEPEVTLRCVDASLKGLRWTQRIPGGWTSSRPYLWHDTVFGGGEHGYLVAIRVSDGARMWSDSLRGTIRAIGSEANRLYIGTLGGTLFAYDPPATAR